MHRVLVVLGDTSVDERLLTAAQRHVQGTDAEILLCRVTDDKEFEAELRQAGRSGEEIEGINDVESAADAEAIEIAEEFFDEDVSVTTLGVVGSIPDDVLRIAADHDCDHVFITGRKRSPTGKVLFGDEAQKVVLNFDGPVTITISSD